VRSSPDEYLELEELDELDEEPIEEVIGIGERMHPERVAVIEVQYEKLLNYKSKLRSRQSKAIREHNWVLQKILFKKLVDVQIKILKKEALLAKRDKEESEQESRRDVSIETPRHEEIEEPTGLITEEDEETEDDEILELAVVLGLEEE
jgi:hypothetical protein